MPEFQILGSTFSPFLPSHPMFYSLGNLISRFKTNLFEISSGSILGKTTSPISPVSPSYLFSFTLLFALILSTTDIVSLFKQNTDHPTPLFKSHHSLAMFRGKIKMPIVISKAFHHLLITALTSYLAYVSSTPFHHPTCQCHVSALTIVTPVIPASGQQCSYERDVPAQVWLPVLAQISTFNSILNIIFIIGTLLYIPSPLLCSALFFHTSGFLMCFSIHFYHLFLWIPMVHTEREKFL